MLSYGSSTIDETKSEFKAAACSLEDGKATTEEGTTKSAQHAQVTTAILTIRQT